MGSLERSSRDAPSSAPVWALNRLPPLGGRLCRNPAKFPRNFKNSAIVLPFPRLRGKVARQRRMRANLIRLFYLPIKTLRIFRGRMKFAPLCRCATSPPVPGGDINLSGLRQKALPLWGRVARQRRVGASFRRAHENYTHTCVLAETVVC